jgi:regulator of nucleoside diphosphate kinase
MKRIRKNVQVIKEEYDLLRHYLKINTKNKFINKQSLRAFNRELKKARIVNKGEFPKQVVRINSTVIVKDTDTNHTMAYTLVLPENINRNQGKISIFSPIGIALIGFEKGLRFTWKFISGKRNLAILEVYNSPSLKTPLIYPG